LSKKVLPNLIGQSDQVIMAVRFNKIRRYLSTEYPFIISPGHIYNTFRETPTETFSTLTKIDASTDPILLGMMVSSFTNYEYEIYWIKYFKRLDKTKHFYFPDIDLVCNIVVRGGTYASFNQTPLKWVEEDQVWKLEQFSKEDPLFVAGRLMSLITDGDFIYCTIGLVAKNRVEYLEQAAILIPEC
jgi:hypothetical protein